ncbi:MAG: hypothetical protein RL217_359 [Pseudomonadota bacterium]|jgi:uncharacterized protein (DUF924 family)
MQSVLNFWFNDIDPKYWWVKDETFDALLRERFLTLLQQAKASELFHWRSSAQGRLAEIIVLDQFSRNIYRNTPAAFAQDGMALVLAQEAVRLGVLNEFTQESECGFLLMPYMHSESRAIHALAAPLFAQYAPAQLEFEKKHRAIIDRFGHYPHRNTLLGRPSTAAELEFLTQPNSSF